MWLGMHLPVPDRRILLPYRVLARWVLGYAVEVDSLIMRLRDETIV